MPAFQYTAVNQSGKTVKGRMEAGSRIELENRLSRLGLDIVSASTSKGLSLQFSRVGDEELAQFCYYLQQLVVGGVPLIEGLSDVRDSVSNPALRNVVGTVIQEIEQGTTLSAALRNYPKIFDPVFVNLVEAGEESGELGTVLQSLGENIKWSSEMKERTKKLFYYPAFALVVIIGAASAMLTLVVPKVLVILTTLDQELPPYTLALIATSEFVQEFWLYILLAPVVTYVGVGIGLKLIPGIDYILDKLKVRMPLFGLVAEKIIMSRFANVFGLLYGAGINVVDALKISQGTLGNQFISRGLEGVINEIVNGKGLSTAFKDSGIFPPLVLRMMRLGETTGGIDSSMRQIKTYYDKDANDAITAVQATIGPLTMFLLAGLIVWLVLAVYAPLYDMLENAQT